MRVKSAFTLSAVLAACLVTGVPIGAAAGHDHHGRGHGDDRDPHGRTLVGHNNAARDLDALQDAADRGGVYLLKGTFNLGDTGSVTITRDVAFIGRNERGCNSDERATILGGTWAFYSHLPAAPVTQPGPAIEIINLVFDGPAGAALHSAYSRRVVFSENTVRNVRALQVGSGSTGYLRANGTVIGTRDAQNGVGSFLAGAVTGRIVMTDNNVDLTVASPTTTNSTGLQIQFADHVEGLVAGNTITSYSRNCGDALDNRGGDIVFSDNYCNSGTQGVPFPTTRAPNGILVGWFFDQPSVNMNIPENHTNYQVLRNHIQINGASSFGLYSSIQGAVIADNEVIVGGGPTALGILTIGPGSLYQNNRISGSGQAAVFVANSLAGVIASGNTYDTNDSSAFTASQAHYFLAPGTTNNVVIHPSGNVINLGTGNTVIP